MTLRHPGPRTRDGVSARSRAAAVLLAGVVLLAGCSTAGTADPAEPVPSEAAPADARTTTTLGRVTGDLDRARRGGARDAVGRVVDRWFAAAYLGRGGGLRSAGDAFPGFTRAAAAQAREDRALTTNAALAPRVDDVAQRRGEVVVDLLATGGRARAATARFVLVMTLTGEAERVERVAGRLYLTPGPSGWQVIGYDVDRGTQR